MGLSIFALVVLQGRVIEVPAEPNAPVKKGDVLLRIDPAPYQAEVDGSRLPWPRPSRQSRSSRRGGTRRLRPASRPRHSAISPGSTST